MRILFLIDNLRPGGAQKALLAILRALQATAAEPVVWCLGGSSRIELDFEAIGVPVLGKPDGFWDTAAEPLALLQYVNQRRISLVQTFLFHSDVVGRTAARCVRLLFGPGKIPVVVSSVRATNRGNRPWQYWLQRLTAPLADAFTAVSRETLEFAARREGVRLKRATVIPNGIDLSDWGGLPSKEAARDALDLPRDALVIGAIGRLHEQKGHVHLLDAARRIADAFPRAVFPIAGYGPLRESLAARARELGLADKVRFLGYRQDVKTILAALDVFVLPSLWEGMSNAVLEAMAAARPVVATAIDGNIEQVVPNETGLLVPPGDAAALADALIELCRRPETLHAMGTRGRERVEKIFPLERMTDATIDLYARLLEEKAGVPEQSWRV